MTPTEQVNAFCSDIERVIDRYRDEFDLTLAEAIGTLEVIKLTLFMESQSDEE